jgi:hypothetical protein
MNQIKQKVDFEVAEKSLPSAFVGDSAPHRSYLLNECPEDMSSLPQLIDTAKTLPKTSVEEIFSDFQSDIDQAHHDFLEAMGLLEL